MLVGVEEPEHVGTLVVSQAALATALGPSAFAVWVLLLDLRDTSRSGKAHGAVYAGIDGFVRMLAARNGVRPKQRAVVRALATLRCVGLLDSLGWRPGTRGSCVYWRRALGLLRPTLGAALVPSTSGTPLATAWERARATGAGTRGGRRVGAGRKPGPREIAHLEQTIKRPDLESNDLTLPKSNDLRSDLSSRLLSQPRNSKNRITAALHAVGVEDSTSRSNAPMIDPWMTRSRPFTPGLIQPYRPLARANLVVHVPAAPRLSPSDTPERHAALLRDWYVAVCERLYPGDRKTVWAVKNKPTQRTRHHARFVAFARACLDLDVRPAAWIHFVASQWRHMGHDKAPPVMAVFSTKRIAAEAKTYDEDGRACACDRLTATATEYMLREKRENLGLVAFPHEARIALLDAIRAEVSAEQAQVDADIEHGKWVWA